jgi:hypothetical protein
MNYHRESTVLEAAIASLEPEILVAKITTVRPPPIEKGIETLILDHRDFSEKSLNDFKKALKSFGLHLGNADEEYGSPSSDTFVLYIAKNKLTKSELKDLLQID